MKGDIIMSRPTKSILIIEDETDLSKILALNFTQEGFDVHRYESGENILNAIKKYTPSVILLDLMIPDKDGFEVCKEIKSHPEYCYIPVLIMSARNQEYNIISGLEIGADDYITKPFSIGVLVAKVRAILRRQRILNELKTRIMEFEALKIIPEQYDCYVDKERISLNPTEFKILCCMANRAGWVFTRNQLINASKGEGYVVTDRMIDVMIASLRKKLGNMSHLIETVRGVGYRLRYQQC